MSSVARLAALFAFLSASWGAQIWAADLADCAGVIVDENGVPLAAAKITLALQGSPAQKISRRNGWCGALFVTQSSRRRLPSGSAQGSFLRSHRANHHSP